MPLLLIIFLPIGICALAGYVYLWRKALKREAEFRRVRITFESMLVEKGWQRITYRQISVIEQHEFGTTGIWFLDKPIIYRRENDFVFLKSGGFDVFFKSENPFKSMIWENQRQINAILEDEVMIELHYSRTFALIERMKIEKDLGPSHRL